MAYDAKSIANYFLQKAKAERKAIDPMKLQKLVYFAHGWYLYFKQQPLISEPVEAWPYGPVIQSIYHEFKAYGRKPIDRLASEMYTLPDGGFDIRPIPVPTDEFTIALLNKIWEVYGKATGIQLSNLTHQPETPWHKTWDERDESFTSVPIANDLITEYFSKQAKK